MGASFLDDFSGDLLENNTFRELQTALKKAVNCSPKSIVVAHYPKNNYETADTRMHIEANLDTIRKNPNDIKAIKIYADIRFTDGTYTSETEPDFAKFEMSYSQLCKLSLVDFSRDIVIALARKLTTWDEAHGLVKDPDPFNAFDGVDEPFERITETASTPSEPNQPSEDSVMALLRNGEKIGAIRLYRELTGVGLAEAKEAVENLALENGIVESGTTQHVQSSISQTNQSAQNSSSSPGCLFTVLVMVGIVFLFGILPQLL